MSEASATAELIEDGGAVAVSDDFFRSRPFLDAEGATHTLRIETARGAELVAPLIVRPIAAGPEHDAISPYGYPGLVPTDGGRHLNRIATQMTTATPFLDPSTIDFAPTGLVSIFLRHRLVVDGPISADMEGKPARRPLPLLGASERNVVQIADPALPAKSRPSDRRQVRKNLEAGYELQLVAAADSSAEQRAGFLDVYEQTMRRAAAAEHYFFGAAYFDRILEADRTWLALALAPTGEIAAASIAAVSDGFLHYYLSGSADSHLRDSPMKNVVAALVELAAELGLPLNLGGGISRGDALEEFKRGFANREQPWHSSEIVCDPEQYGQLSANRAAGGFFPAYRAP